MSTVRSDIKFLRYFILYSKMLGVYPVVIRKERKLAKFLYRLYLIVLWCLIGVAFFISLYTKIQMWNKNGRITHSVIDFMAMLNEVLFVIVCRVAIIWNYEMYMNFQQSITNMEQCLNYTDFSVKKGNMLPFFSRIIFVHFVFFGLHIREFLIKLNNGDLEILLYNLYHVLTLYHQIIILQMVTITNYFLFARYRFLRTQFHSIIQSEKCITIGLKFRKKLKLKEAFILFKKISKVSFYMSKTFGMHVFLASSSTVIICLNCIVFLSFVGDNKDLFIYLAHTLTYIFSYIIVVLRSENVESESRKIIRCCYENQESLSGNHLEFKLMRFAEVCNHLVPKFSAAGFFIFNKSVLSSVFSAILTYLITIIQLDIALRKP